jgi:hypothetical protein
MSYYGIVGLLILVLDIYVIYLILTGSGDPGMKLLVVAQRHDCSCSAQSLGQMSSDSWPSLASTHAEADRLRVTK